ncbi:MAG: putative DNA-binding domain-containing protein [Burkholderiaceae bacterium]
MSELGAEAARQQALLRAIARGAAVQNEAGLAPLAPGRKGASAGLWIYRANADALAERALAGAFPTLRALLGTDDFKHMACEFWQADPPQRGDVAEWGGSLPDWLGAHPGFAQWPYLGDCAQLDWLRHGCERAADASFDGASLALLESHDPGQLRLVLRPGVALLDSRWPVASLYAAHQADAMGFDAARDAIAAGRGEAVVVARRGWRAEVHRIDAPTCAWTRDLLAGLSLGQALTRAAREFDFTAWLSSALAQEWLERVLVLPD